MALTVISNNRWDGLLHAAPRALRPAGAVLLDEVTGPGEFEELCWQYLHKLPGEFRLGQIKTRIETEAGAYGGQRYEFDSRLFLRPDPSTQDSENEPEPVGQLMVTLYRKPGGTDDEIFLELEQCQIWYPHLRGSGLGRKLVNLVMELGRALGVKALTAIAIYDGRFVWPALGFRFGDYLPDDAAAAKFRERFIKFCQRHYSTPPDVTGWDAPDFARFFNGLELRAPVGHRMDREQKLVGFGRAFLLSRRPFFLTYPLETSPVYPTL